MGVCCSRTDETSLDKFRSVSSSRGTVAPTPSDFYITTKNLSIHAKKIDDEPISPLDEALRNLHGVVPNLAEKIGKAKKFCNKSKRDGVTPDESAAIYLYSMEKDEESFFAFIQNAMRSKITPYEKFLKLYFNGYKKLPKLKKDVWLIVPFDDEWAKMLRSENPQLQTRMGPAKISLLGDKEFLNQKFGESKIVVKISNSQAANMADYIPEGVRETVLFPELKLRKVQEIFLPFETKLNPAMKVGQLKTKMGLTVFHLIVSTGNEKIETQIHFVCPISACHRQCKYETSHSALCNGCYLLIHRDCHHTKPWAPVIKCSFCLKTHPESRQCKQCQGHFCHECCMKKIFK